MTEQADWGVPDWLPLAAQRNLIHEAAQQRADAVRAERDLEGRRDRLHDEALQAYRQAAEARGEYVSALELAAGEVAGRTVQDVFASALEAAEREDARSAARERRERQGEAHVEFGEPVIGRSGWPASEYELDRQLERASALHRDFVAYMAKRDYPAAAEAARARSGRPAMHASLGSRSREQDGYEREVTRLVDAGYSLATAQAAATPVIYR
jgi:hypothetical protein